ncbi:AsmA family protein [Bradyrhizobium sp. SYSU BS000235]|uniref:AsmA family protein n=1 Tax=Bradyrhizobium sp. SYSU BS000235 TaxID=3411332 RepID=UPI003C710CA9
MQTTLLGLAIALIVALVAALIGPFFIDWNQFRPQFEAEASRVMGAPVRVDGTLDARLLPTPTLRLQSVTVGGDGDAGKVHADKLDVEFSLSSLMRGDWRASELSLNGFALDLGLDREGRFEWPASIGKFSLGSLTIDRLNLTGRMSLNDAASGTTFHIDDLIFNGDVRALAGVVRGEGAFTLQGTRMPFRVSSGQTNDGKGTRVRFSADHTARAVSGDLDGVLTFDAQVPKFEGALTLTRPADAKSNSTLPWKISSRLKANPSSATFDQIEAVIGPEESALRLTGGGDLGFGTSPQLRLTLSARQLDADRLLAKDAANSEPLRLLPATRSLLTALPPLPIATHIELSAEQIALGGRSIQNFAASLQGGPDAWVVDKLELQSTGSTRLSLSGAIKPLGENAGFSGPFDLRTGTAKTLADWLQGRSFVSYRSELPVGISGNLSVGKDQLSISAMKADIDGSPLEGRVAFQGARLDAEVKSPSADLDDMKALLNSAAGPQFEWPSEAKLSVEIARAKLGGEDVSPVIARLSYGPKVASIERLDIGRADNMAISGSGSFDRGGNTGKLSFAATVPSLDRISGFIAPFSSAVADRLNALAKTPEPARLKLSASLDKASDRNDRMNARAVLDIDSPQIKGAMTLAATPPRTAVQSFDTASLERTEFNVETTLASNQTTSMLKLLGLDGVLAAQDGPAKFESSVAGVWRAPLRVKAKLSGAGVDGDLQGTADPLAEPSTAALNVAIRHADLGAWFDIKPTNMASLDASLTSRVSMSGPTFKLEDIDSTIGGARVRGHLTLTRGDETGIDGEIGMNTLDLPSVTALAFGATGHDPSEPLGRGLLRGWRGKLSFEALRAALPGSGELRPLKGAVKGDGKSLVLENVKGSIGGGEATVALDARQTVQGTSINARLQLTNVDGTALRYRGLAMPQGQTSLDMSLASQARSAAGLSGALSGAGTMTLKDARIAGLDPRAFEVGIRASDNGQAFDDESLKRIVDPVLSAGALPVASAQVPFTIRDGRLRVETTTIEGERGRVLVAGGYDLAADQADIRAVLSPIPTRPITGRPEIRIDLNGSPDAMTRSIDVAALSSWLAMRAIDRETRRLDQLEQGVTAPPPESDDLWEEPAAEPLPQSDVRIPHRDPRRKLPAAAKPAPPRVSVPPAANPQVSKPDPSVANSNVQPLPPPITVRPAPGAVRAPPPPRPRPAPPLVLTPPSSGTF